MYSFYLRQFQPLVGNTFFPRWPESHVTSFCKLRAEWRQTSLYSHLRGFAVQRVCLPHTGLMNWTNYRRLVVEYDWGGPIKWQNEGCIKVEELQEYYSIAHKDTERLDGSVDCLHCRHVSIAVFTHSRTLIHWAPRPMMGSVRRLRAEWMGIVQTYRCSETFAWLCTPMMSHKLATAPPLARGWINRLWFLKVFMTSFTLMCMKIALSEKIRNNTMLLA